MPEDWIGVLGLAVIVAIVLAAVVLLALGRGRGN
jgi:hypothetical protein